MSDCPPPSPAAFIPLLPPPRLHRPVSLLPVPCIPCSVQAAWTLTLLLSTRVRTVECGQELISEFKGRRHIAFQTFYCGSFPNCVKQEESELLVFVIQLEQLSVHRQPSVVFHLHPLPFGITFEANPRCHVMSSTNISVSVFYNRKVKVKSLSRVRLFATPWTVAHQTPLSMGFSRQESWSGLPFPSPGDLPNPGIEPRSPTL